MPTEYKQGGVQFINFDLDEATKKKYKAWCQKAREELNDAIDRLLDSGFNLSVKFDGYGGGFGAYIQPRDKKHALAGWILSSRASTPTNAILGVLYRHYVIFDGNWPTEGVRRVGMDDD